MSSLLYKAGFITEANDLADRIVIDPTEVSEQQIEEIGEIFGLLGRLDDFEVRFRGKVPTEALRRIRRRSNTKEMRQLP